jgi:hypothetical protein
MHDDLNTADPHDPNEILPGDIEPHDDVERTLKVVRHAYGWLLDIDGRLCGLVAGDMGYESTHIVIPKEDLEAWIGQVYGIDVNDPAVMALRKTAP